MHDLKLFELNAQRRFQTFTLEQSYSYISIEKIVVTSLFGLKPTEWFTKFMRANPFLKITCSKRSEETLEYQVYLVGLVSPHHAQPVFEFNGDFNVPEQNMLNRSALYMPYDKAKIELCFSGEEDSGMIMTCFYITRPGAHADA